MCTHFPSQGCWTQNWNKFYLKGERRETRSLCWEEWSTSIGRKLILRIHVSAKHCSTEHILCFTAFNAHHVLFNYINVSWYADCSSNVTFFTGRMRRSMIKICAGFMSWFQCNKMWNVPSSCSIRGPRCELLKCKSARFPRFINFSE